MHNGIRGPGPENRGNVRGIIEPACSSKSYISGPMQLSTMTRMSGDASAVWNKGRFVVEIVRIDLSTGMGQSSRRKRAIEKEQTGKTNAEDEAVAAEEEGGGDAGAGEEVERVRGREEEEEEEEVVGPGVCGVERNRGEGEGKGEEEEEERGKGRREVGIADGDGDGRVNVLALALGHGELRPTTQGRAPLYFAQRRGARERGGTVYGGEERGWEAGQKDGQREGLIRG
ncbi:hypothetical protein WH47_04918 [Habropoda laboriosa]|uniref:Uncharacterized protein n=1 Tax=Habropoda laboriosa TaxID=597456 RepID=A0A0L7RJ02_9HYME|nr:hypothetical protein WH47_04918 [Habropoda laboriosa]